MNQPSRFLCVRKDSNLSCPGGTICFHFMRGNNALLQTIMFSIYVKYVLCNDWNLKKQGIALGTSRVFSKHVNQKRRREHVSGLLPPLQSFRLKFAGLRGRVDEEVVLPVELRP